MKLNGCGKKMTEALGNHGILSILELKEATLVEGYWEERERCHREEAAVGI